MNRKSPRSPGVRVANRPAAVANRPARGPQGRRKSPRTVIKPVAGEKRVTVQTTNKLLDEGREAGALRESNRAAVSIDMLTTNMPKPLAGEASVCWVFGLGPAFPLATMHLPAGPAPQVVAAPAIDKPAALPTAQQLI